MVSPAPNPRPSSQTWRIPVALAGAFAAAPVASAPLTAQVKGLPAGLSVQMSVSLARCPGNGRLQFVPAGSIPLAENTINTVERVTVPFARVPRSQRVSRTQYEGTVNVQLPTSNGCSSVPVGTGRRTYEILGRTPDGQPGERAAVIPMVLQGGATQVSDTISARTTAIVRDQQPLGMLAIGAPNRVATGFSNSFGSAAITRPVLEIQRQRQFPNALGPGVFGTVVRFSLTDDLRACLLVVGAGSQCGPLEQGGTLQVGGVSLNVAQSSFSAPLSGAGRTMTWTFTLTNGFATRGTWRVVAHAEDADAVAPLVEGQPRSLDLLPWTPLAVPITFTSP